MATMMSVGAPASVTETVRPISARPKPLRDRLTEHNQKEKPKTELHTIFRVPPILRDVDRDAYDPKVVSLGPYHRGEKALEAMEEHKMNCLQKFIDRSSPNKSFDDHVADLKELVEDARNCYSEKVDVVDDDHDEFADMMLLDGSFIIEYLLMCAEKKHDNEVLGSDWMNVRIAGDMLMLENQIPFIILQKLYDSVEGNKTNRLLTLVHDFFSLWLHIKMASPTPKEPPEPKYHHLLHYVHSCIVSTAESRIDVPPADAESQASDNQKPAWLPCFKTRNKSPGTMPRTGPYSIPTAAKLREAGIKFREKKAGSPLEVTFHNGVLEMAKLSIFGSSRVFYRNLMAFEIYHTSSGSPVTEHLAFIDMIVDTPADVAVLQHEGVLRNGLGSEKEAANFINLLCKNAVLSEPKERWEKLFRDVHEHYESRWPRWRAKLVTDYFGSPWSAISLVAAIVLLVLTVIQTVYSTLSYERPV